MQKKMENDMETAFIDGFYQAIMECSQCYFEVYLRYPVPYVCRDNTSCFGQHAEVHAPIGSYAS